MRKITSKKAQIKIKEMIFMIIALVIFFAIVLMFFLSISLSGLKNNVAQSSRDKAIILLSRLADAPEFSCGKTNCVDTDKLVILISHPFYKTFWEVDGLVVEKITNNNLNGTVECNVGNYPRCNSFTIKKPLANTIPDSSITSLCRKEVKNGYSYDQCDVGRITVWSKI